MARWLSGAAAILALSLGIGSGGAGAATTTGVETAASIRSAIADALKPRLAAMNEATAEIGAIDSRLRLPACPALEIGLPPVAAAAMTAKVDCPLPAWTIYVPVRLHAWVDAVVAATNLAPSTKLTADELSRGRVDMFSTPGGLVTEPARAEGRILRVGLVAGAPILTTFLERPLVVHRGQKVLLTLTDSTMVIRSTVVALEDGHVGDSIPVQNPETRKTIQATVAADGTVTITF